MKTDFDIARSYVSAATIFNSEFNTFANISANQAWALFFTAGRDDAALGDNPEVGAFFNNVLIAVVVSVIAGSFFLRSF
ncbi:hypothetical protein [Argonema antarcticum]|uniref:hypothetical protein n=1 Tax=Argonema antarcticum TaxID=2942763 RepID=UPI002011DDA5|nr:hypothetical protein [Argonema antarcticum]MCL1473717.1 hypothetical protein [Argonema antarcticum A004/B2]